MARTIIITGEINSNTFKRVSKQLQKLEKLNEECDIQPVIIEINSEGGNVYDALAIVGRIQASPCHITTKGFGCIMSAATLILAAGNKREISRYAWFMTHEASDALKGSVSAIGHALNQARKEELQWAVIMEELTDTPKEAWLEMATKSTYLTAADCLQYGVADLII